MAVDEVTRKQRAMEADRRRKARKRAAKSGLPGPPLLRMMKPKRPHAKTPEEKAVRAIERREAQRLASALYRQRHPEQRRLIVKKSNDRHADDRCKSRQEYNSRPETTRRKRIHKHARLAKDAQFKVRTYLSKRMVVALRRVTGGQRKTHRTIAMLGCTIPALMQHLESKFWTGMSWDNYGALWHIDHIRPCASYDLSDQAQQLLCFHYTNLQPLWGSDNIRKGSRLDWSPPSAERA